MKKVEGRREFMCYGHLTCVTCMSRDGKSQTEKIERQMNISISIYS